MGNMRPIDSAVVKNETYDVLSADTMGGEYIETIGAACQNPDGYTSGSLFLGKDNDVQHLYRATAAIAFGETIILDTNCAYTTVSGELEGKAEESEVSSLNEALTQDVAARALGNTHNLVPFYPSIMKQSNLNGVWDDNKYSMYGVDYIVNDDGSIIINGTATQAHSFVISVLKLDASVGAYILATVHDIPSECFCTVADANWNVIGSIRGGYHGVEFTIENDQLVNLYFYMGNGITLDNYILQPLIRLYGDRYGDQIFTKFAQTNRILTEDKAEKNELSDIRVSGFVNNTGATITKDTFFYLDNALVKAKVDIANGAAFVKNTNYEAVTGGVINNLATGLFGLQHEVKSNTYYSNVDANGYTTFGFYHVGITSNGPTTNNSFGMLIVFTGGNGFVAQLYLTTDNILYFRYRNTSSSNWLGWQRVLQQST